MAILSFGFTKIHVEKKTSSTKQIKIQSGMNITDVKASEMIKDAKQKAFAVKFTFEIKYEPGVAVIELDGELIFLANQALAKEVEAGWAKRKSLPKDLALTVFNRILHNCNVEALILSKEMNLPAPIQLPKVQAQREDGSKPSTKAKKVGA